MNYTILAIDDEEICLEVIELFLEANNYRVIKAIGGRAGIEALELYKEEIDVIMLDLMMPDLPGVEVLKIIKADPIFKNIPVILQTGSSNDIDLEDAKSNSKNISYIRKPYDCEDLLSAVVCVVKEKRNIFELNNCS